MGSEWTETTLGDIASKDGYGLVDGPFGSNLPAASYTETGIPVVRGSNLSLGATRFRSDEFVFVSPETASKLERSLCRPLDIVFTKKGTLGQSGLIPEGNFPEYLLSSNQMKLSVDRAIADPLFVYYFVSSPESIAKIIRDSESTGVPKTNVAYLRNFPITLPPLPEQRAIAEVLGSLDDKIELNRRMNRTLESMAECIYVDTFSESSAWDTKRLDQLTSVSIGRTPPRKEPQWFSQEETDIPWVSIRDMGNAGMYIVETSERLTHDAVDKFNVRIIPRRTIIVSFKLTVGRVALAGFDLATNEAIAHLPLDTDSGLCGEYLYFALKRFPYETLASTSSIATAVNSSTIRAIPIALPPIELVREFQGVVAPIFEMIEHTIHQARTLEELRDTLLPKLLSGELPLAGEH